MILRCESKAFYKNKNYKTLQNVLLRCPGHFNKYINYIYIPVSMK